MHFRLYKMTLEGKIAVANMLLIGAVFLVFPLTVTSFVPNNSDVLSSANAPFAVLALTFPVGWLGWYFMDRFCDQPLLAVLLAVVFVPLNAYLWGYVLGKLVRAVCARK